jgi:hypothetical protein
MKDFRYFEFIHLNLLSESTYRLMMGKLVDVAKPKTSVHHIVEAMA